VVSAPSARRNTDSSSRSVPPTSAVLARECVLVSLGQRILTEQLELRDHAARVEHGPRRAAELEAEVRELHVVLEAALHRRVREVYVLPADGAVLVAQLAQPALAREHELPRAVAREHARQELTEWPRELERLGVEVAERRAQMLDHAVRARLGAGADGKHALRQDEQRGRALRANERLRQQLVAHLLLELALRAPAGLLLHARAVLLEPRLESFVQCAGGQHANLAPQPHEVRARDAAREKLRLCGDGRLEA